MKKLGILVALVLVALLAACGGRKPAAQPTAAPAPAGQAGTSAKGVAQATAAPTVKAAAKASVATKQPAEVSAAEKAAAAPTESADSLALDSRNSGLDKLKSYRLRWVAEWTGDGEAGQGNWEWMEEYTADPRALHLSWISLDTTSTTQDSAMEMWQIGDTSYVLMHDEDGQANCMSFSSDEESGFSQGTFSPDLLGSVEDAQYVGTEQVNGISSRHYRYDERSAGLAGLGKVSGEIWVAVNGGFVVKDVVNWQGALGIFGGGADQEGSGQWYWELSNVDGPIAIAVPADCVGAAEGLPLMPDASSKSQIGDMITYETASAVDEVVAFYQEGMPAADWEATEDEPQVSDETATLNFVKDGKQAQIIVSAGEDKTSVVINVSN